MDVFELQSQIAALPHDTLVVVMDPDGLDYQVVTKVRFVDSGDPSYPFPHLQIWCD